MHEAITHVAIGAITHGHGAAAAGSVIFLVIAGVGAGLCGSVAGIASLMSYPALLAVGLPPISANVTNTVSLIFSTVGSAAGSRPELDGQGARLRRLGVAALCGGCAGGLLLLLTPADAFARVVPWLIGLGSVVILLPRRVREAPGGHATDGLATSVGVFLVAIYGGYFGAAAGVLLLSLLLASTSDTVARANALKNMLLGAANAVAATLFVIFSSVQWVAAIPLAAGILVGSRLGPVIVRRAPQMLLRVAISLAGIGLAVYLGMYA